MLFKSSIGIEINDFQVNIVYLKGSFKGLNPAVTSSCRLSSEASAQDRQADIVGFINGFIREEKISAADIFIGISASHLMMREIAFPLAVRENLRTTLSYEIEKYIPVSAEDIYFDYQVISESKEEESLKLLLVAVHKDALDYYLEISEELDLGVSGIGIVSAAIANYYRFHQESFPDSLFLVSSAGSGYDTAVLRQGTLVYAKSIAASNTPENDFSQVCAQLARLRDIFCPDKETAQALLYGVPSSGKLFAELSKEFPNISDGKLHSPSQGEQFVSAFGLALNGISEVPVEINLMPVSMRKKPNKTGIYVMFGLAVLLAVSVFVWAGSHFMVQQKILQTLDTELNRLRKEAVAVEQIQAETEQLENEIKYFQSLRPGGQYVVEITEALSRIIPPDAHLSEMKLDGNELSLYGTAESASGLISLLESSPLFGNVEFISAIRKDKSGKEAFRIQCEIESVK